jgi:hypothetical protein
MAKGREEGPSGKSAGSSFTILDLSGAETVALKM